MNENEVQTILEKNGWANFDGKHLKDQGMKHLCRSKINNFNEAKLTSNSISIKGMIHMREAQWFNLTHLALGSHADTQDNNCFGDKGCKYLTTAKIPKLKWLNLRRNICNQDFTGISHLGIGHLSKSNWKMLKDISLKRNFIGGEGIAKLVKADWRKMQVLFISKPLQPNEMNKILTLHIEKFTKLSTDNYPKLWDPLGRSNEHKKMLSLLRAKYSQLKVVQYY